MNQKRFDGFRLSHALVTTLLPIVSSGILFFTDEAFSGDLRKVSVILFAPCAYIGAIATLYQPRLLRRFCISCAVCFTPYVSYSFAVYVIWKFRLAEFEKLSGFVVVGILALISLTFPTIFFFSLAVGTGFFGFIRDQLGRIPIRILPPKEGS